MHNCINYLFHILGKPVNLRCMQDLNNKTDVIQEYATVSTDWETCWANKYETLENRKKAFEKNVAITLLSLPSPVKLQKKDDTGVFFPAFMESLRNEKPISNDKCILLQEVGGIDINSNEWISTVMTDYDKIAFIPPELSASIPRQLSNNEMVPIMPFTSRLTAVQAIMSDNRNIIVSLLPRTQLIDNEKSANKVEKLIPLIQVDGYNIKFNEISRNLLVNVEIDVEPPEISKLLQISYMDDNNIFRAGLLVVNKSEIDDYLRTLLEKAGLVIDFSKCSPVWTEEFLPKVNQMVINFRKINPFGPPRKLEFIKDIKDNIISTLDRFSDVKYEESVRIDDFFTYPLQMHCVNRRFNRLFSHNCSVVKKIECKPSTTLRLTSVPTVISDNGDIIFSLPSRTEFMNKDISARIEKFPMFLQTTGDNTNIKKDVSSDLLDVDEITIRNMYSEVLLDLPEMLNIGETKISPSTSILKDDNEPRTDDDDPVMENIEPKIDDYLRYLEDSIEDDRSFKEWFEQRLSNFILL